MAAGFILAVVVAGSLPAYGQPLPEELRVVPRADGPVYIFHTARMPLGYGFNIYRQVDGGAEVQLNEAPVRGAQHAQAFRTMTGPAYERLVDEMDVDSPQQVFFRLRADRMMATLASYTSTDVARALGRLYVDEEAPDGSEATYRVEFVDLNDDPTDASLTATIPLTPMRPAPPTELEAEHNDQEITLRWRYPTSTPAIPDQVVRYNVYRQNDAGEPERINGSDVVLRRVSENVQLYRFPVEVLGRTEEYFVTAVDVTGQESAPSEVLTYEVRDNVPPAVVRRVDAWVGPDHHIEVTWPTSPEPDVVGYHLYRARRTVDDGERINAEMIDPFETLYLDSTLTRAGAFFYRVTAVDASGNESTPSDAAMVLVQDRQAPEPPAGLEAEYDTEADRFVLRWQAAPPAPDFETYVIVRRNLNRDTRSFARINIENVQETTFTDHGEAGQGFEDGAFYEFGVTTADGTRNHSDTVFVRIQVPDLTPPEAPRNLQAHNDDGLGVDLRWNPSPALDVTTYRVYRAAGGDEARLMAQLPAPVAFVRDDSVVVGTRYAYHVTAVDSAGNESAPSAQAALTMRDHAPPRSVRNVQALALEAGGVRLAWGSVAAADLVRYRIYRADIPTGTYALVHEAPASETTWTDPQGTVGHWYRVHAVDTSDNESRPSRPGEAVPQAP